MLGSLAAGVPSGTRRKLPDMPRWAISVPLSALISRYLARRSTTASMLTGKADIQVFGYRPAQAPLTQQDTADPLAQQIGGARYRDG